MKTRLAFFGATAIGAAFAVIAACGGSDASGPGAGADSGGGGDGGTGPQGDGAAGDGALPPPTPGAGAAFCDDTYKAYFTAYTACCNAADMKQPEYALFAFLTVITTACEADLESGIAKNRLTIDPGSASQCEGAFQALINAGICGKTSSELGALVTNISAQASACNTAVVGFQDVGQPCAGDYECKAGLTCVGWTVTSSGTPNTDGMCAAPPAIGQPCGEGATDGGALTVNLNLGDHPGCATGAYCNKTCAAQRADGMPCAENPECLGGQCHEEKCGTQGPTGTGTGCNSNSDCVDTDWCQPDGGGVAVISSGSCQEKEPAGQTCSGPGGFFQSGQCKGLCDVPDGGDAGTCTSFCGSN